jgi:hypothetical protein
VSDSGWTNNEIGLAYLVKVFHEQTKHLYPLWRLIILDGHGSHLTYGFIHFCREHHIIVICLPAHATAMIQPLDVVIFSPLSNQWSKVLEAELVGGLCMRKQDFCKYELRS